MQLLSVLKEVSSTENKNVVMTDQFSSYNVLNSSYIHLKVDHSKMFANGGVHTNTIESFWATLKLGVYGIYHHLSTKHLQKYIDEFCFRYKNRGHNMFDMVLKQSAV